jgi:hypothetical protein
MENRKLSHESLIVYQRAIEFVAWSSQLCQCNGGITGEIQPGKALLVEIVAMLTTLAKSVAGERVREPESIYHPPSP